MSRTRFAATLSAAFIVASATCALAVDHDYGRSGPYLSAGGMYAFENFDGDATAHGDPDDSWGYYLQGGYRFNEWFAIDADWEHFLAFDDPSIGSDHTSIWSIGADAKFYPFHGIVQPYVLVGGAYANVDASTSQGDSGSGAAFRFGGGRDRWPYGAGTCAGGRADGARQPGRADHR